MPEKSETPKGLTLHRAFRDALANARFESYRADSSVRVATEEEFERMRRHLLALHEGVEIQHSFVDAAGHVFDCVPVSQQPSLKGQSQRSPLPEAPSLPDLTGEKKTPSSAKTKSVAAQSDQVDRYGNAMRCPPGCVPIRRVTLGELARFGTLADFFRKRPPLNPSAPSSDVSQNHRYAYTQQDVNNLGAHNFLNVWSPSVGTHQIFSLSQHWYSAGSGSGHQTLEVGWQVYPGKYGHNQPVLFIYWTADNYVSTGAYNLDGPGFVQTNPAWTIGGALSPVSADGGAQYEVEVAVYLFRGNWWLYLGGITADKAVGYFPASIYAGGAMASNATSILFGGETVCDGTGPWPPMGSGQMASAGWTHAAYHRDIFFFPTAGGAQYAALTGQTPSPACYTQAVGNALAPWNIYFFYGGAGAGDC